MSGLESCLSLQIMCLKHLADNLEQVLEDAADVLTHFISPRGKAILLGAARRRGLLSESVECLVDDTWCYLDLTDPAGTVAPGIVRYHQVLPHLARLRAVALDVESFGDEDIFQLLASHCPDLEYLRVEMPPNVSSERHRAHLKRFVAVVPRLRPRPSGSGTEEGEGDGPDSWEEQQPWRGKLANLRYLVWSGFNFNDLWELVSQCPKISIFHTHEDALAAMPPADQSKVLPLVFGEDLTAEMCEEILDDMAIDWRDGGGGAGALAKEAESTSSLHHLRGLKDQIPIAERFRYGASLFRSSPHFFFLVL